MTELLIFRHAQASAGTDDYDRLSDNGHRQSALLGDWLATAGLPFDAVVCGAMLRHRQTLDAIRASFGARELQLPVATVLEDLNEFDHHDVLAAFARSHPESEVARAAMGGRSKDLRALYFFLRAGLYAWAEGQLDHQVSESFGAFQARIRRAAHALGELCRGHQRVLVVTSGGVMSQMAQIALDVANARSVELNLSIRNSALSEFRLIDDRLHLMSWNGLPHLASAEQRALWTYY